MRRIPVDGSPERVVELTTALDAALRGGPTVFPLGPGTTVSVTTEPGPGAAVVLATSGSTSEPKLVVLSAAALRASADAAAARLGGPARWLLALPAEHVAGVQVIVRARHAGGTPVVQDVRGGFRPDDFALATARLGPGRRCTSLVPTQLRRIVEAGGAALDALTTFDAVLVGGAALEPAMRIGAQSKGVRVVTTYGMTETAGGCVYDGRPLDGVTADLDEEGRILLGGPTLADGYLGRPDETAAAFEGGRFRTGDLGSWAQGHLHVLGRADDVIITGGQNVSPAAVERVLGAQPGVRAACVVGLPDVEWGQLVAAAVVLDPGPGPAKEQDWIRLRTSVRDELGRAAVPRRFRAVAEIPLRGVGKPDRAAVARLMSAEPAQG